jgi:hypothetical protein
MRDSRSVNLVVDLPADLADEVERVQQSDPDFIEKVLTYGLVRRAVFARLQGVTALHRPSTSPFETTLESSIELR